MGVPEQFHACMVRVELNLGHSSVLLYSLQIRIVPGKVFIALMRFAGLNDLHGNVVSNGDVLGSLWVCLCDAS